MSLTVSIIICCHNSAARLPETLAHLGRQRVEPALDWEIVLVDNNSTDGTGEVAVACCPEQVRHRLRVVHEAMPGVNAARLRGIRAARFDIVGFVDDDNWVGEDWLRTVAEIFAENAAIGVINGPSEAAFETTPAPWFERVQGYYAVGPQYPVMGDITNESGALFWGAGMALRRVPLIALLDSGFELITTSRKGGQLQGGEDSEFCFALKAMGWRLHYDSRLKLRHFMPAARLTWPYAIKLMRGMGLSAPPLTGYAVALRMHPFDKQPAWKTTWLFQLLKSVKALVVFTLHHPGAAIFRTENDPAVLEFERLRAVAVCWLTFRRQHTANVRRLRAAKWNPHSKSSSCKTPQQPSL